jgi:hypothetical protein
MKTENYVHSNHRSQIIIHKNMINFKFISVLGMELCHGKDNE